MKYSILFLGRQSVRYPKLEKYLKNYSTTVSKNQKKILPNKIKNKKFDYIIRFQVFF